MNKILLPLRARLLDEILKAPDKNPCEFLYGTYELHQKFPDLSVEYFLEPRALRDTLFKKLLYIFELPFNRMAKMGMPHEIYCCHRKSFVDAEKIFCINDAISFAVLFWKMLGFVKGDVYTLFQALTERHMSFFGKKRLLKMFIKKLLSYSEKILVFCDAARNELVMEFGISPERIEVFRFGVDLSYWKYCKFDSALRDGILTLGNDMNRDYETLSTALENENFSLKIISRKEFSGKACEQRHWVNNDELRRYYRKARLVVIPSRKLRTESAGMSSVLQAMACGTPVITSRIPPLEEMFSHDENIVFYEPEDPASLRDAVKRVYSDEEICKTLSANARELVKKEFNSVKMAEQMEKILKLN